MTERKVLQTLLRTMGSNSELNEALRYACLAILDKGEEEPEPVPEEKKQEQKPEPKAKEPEKKTKKALDVGKMVACYKAGWSMSKIADELGCTSQTVANNLKKAGVKQ